MCVFFFVSDAADSIFFFFSLSDICDSVDVQLKSHFLQCDLFVAINSPNKIKKIYSCVRLISGRTP